MIKSSQNQILEQNLSDNVPPLPTEPFTTLTRYERLATLPVQVGSVTLGGQYPIRIQSMTIAAPDDVEGLIKEINILCEAGAELVRLTVPSLKAVKNLEKVKARLDALGIKTPLVADVHFTPNAALEAAQIVEKVRINPGNYVDKKRFANVVLSEQEYADELERIEEKLVPLLDVCKKHHTALRIGVNHGSLSDRIVTRYGDSPYGMTESALEFLTLAEKHNFNQIVFSMKSSNPVTMVQAYRLLVQRMKARGILYPLHLGVTEAGDGELGRIKSATGMGALLVDGIGDTIRVSLTEDSIHELPVCKKIRAMSETLQQNPKNFDYPVKAFHFYDFARRKSSSYDDLGGEEVPKVLFSSPFEVSYPPAKDELAALGKLGLLKRSDIDKWETGEYAPDGFFVKTIEEAASLPPGLHKIFPYSYFEKGLASVNWQSADRDSALVNHVLTWSLWEEVSPYKSLYYATLSEFLSFKQKLDDFSQKDKALTLEKLTSLTHYVKITLKDLALIESQVHQNQHCFQQVVWVVVAESEHEACESRTLVLALLKIDEKLVANRRLEQNNNGSGNLYPDDTKSVGNLPILLWIEAESYRGLDVEAQAVKLSFAIGPLFIDGLVDGVYLNQGGAKDLELIFAILQATRRRISKVDYISCPSCGRTLFDLQQVTAKIKKRTSHLKNIKIGIMGCIVNGPGEMADADYGYVGSGVDKITLYKGQNIVKRSVPAEKAVDALVELIREHGEWIDPPTTNFAEPSPVSA